MKNLVKDCHKSHQCAKDLSKQVGALKSLGKRSKDANRKLQRDIVACEKRCGVR